jgi:hypothetical protein
MLLSTELQGQMVLHILQENLHKPFQDGKANRYMIEEAITIGIYKGELPPCDQEDVDNIISCVDDLIREFGKINNGI